MCYTIYPIGKGVLHCAITIMTSIPFTIIPLKFLVWKTANDYNLNIPRYVDSKYEQEILEEEKKLIDIFKRERFLQ